MGAHLDKNSPHGWRKRNPIRAEQLAASRADKRARVERLVVERNSYLAAHRRAKVSTAARAVEAKLQQSKIDAWLVVKAEGRTLKLTVDPAALEEASRLDGCYVLKTDLPPSAASKQVIHDRYKAFGAGRAGFPHLQNRPPGNA